MTKRYDSPAAFRTALETRLRRRAREEERDLNRLRQLVLFERVLARLYGHFDLIHLKGGMALEVRLGRARTTRDLDLYIGDGALEATAILVASLLRVQDPVDFLSFEQRGEIEQQSGTGPGGLVRVTLQPLLGGEDYGARFHIDLTDDAAAPGAADHDDGRHIFGFLGLDPTRHPLLTLPVHVAEKVHAYTLPRSTPNTRLKDLIDLALLSQHGEYGATSLRDPLESTFTVRGTHALPSALPEPPAGWKDRYPAQREQDILSWETLALLFATVQRFIDPILGGAHFEIWHPDRQRWE